MQNVRGSTMKIVAVNGSPRKNWNTDALLKNVLEGAASKGAETKMVYLYDLSFSGCKSCMSCKLKGGKNLGRCVLRDDLTPVLDEVHASEALVLGSPMYWHEVTGVMRCFIERFLFQYLNYDDPGKPLSPQKDIALIYAMNMPENMLEGSGYLKKFSDYQELFAKFFGHCSVLYAPETLQVKDYSKYHLAVIDGEARQRRHETVFPLECQKAYELGVSMVMRHAGA